MLADVSAKLLDQFVDNLEKTVLVDEPVVEPVEAVEVELEDPIEAVQPDAGRAADDRARAGPAPHPPRRGAEEDADEEGGGQDSRRQDPAPPPRPSRSRWSKQAPPSAPRRHAAGRPPGGPQDRLTGAGARRPVGAAGSPVARRVGPVLAAIAVVWVLKKLLSRNKD